MMTMTETMPARQNGKGKMTFKDLVVAQRDSIAAVLPKHLTPDRIVKIAQVAVSRVPKLMQCDPLNILTRVMEAAQLGFDCSGLLGQAYLVPFFNGKTKRMEAQLIIGYRGLIDLARRSGEIFAVDAYAVHEKDHFEYELGMEPRLVHKPYLKGGPGDVLFFYAIGRHKNGYAQCDVMTKHEVDAIRRRSKSSDSGPWVTDYEEMGKKTVVKRLCKRLPQSVDLANALAIDNAADDGNAVEMIDGMVTAAESHDIEPSKSKTDLLADKLSGDLPDADAQPPAPEEPSIDAAEGEAVGEYGEPLSDAPAGNTPDLSDFPAFHEACVAAVAGSMEPADFNARFTKACVNYPLKSARSKDNAPGHRKAVLEAFIAGKLNAEGKIEE